MQLATTCMRSNGIACSRSSGSGKIPENHFADSYICITIQQGAADRINPRTRNAAQHAGERLRRGARTHTRTHTPPEYNQFASSYNLSTRRHRHAPLTRKCVWLAKERARSTTPNLSVCAHSHKLGELYRGMERVGGHIHIEPGTSRDGVWTSLYRVK